MAQLHFSTVLAEPLRLPPLVAGTTGHIAHPDPDRTVACVQAPAALAVKCLTLGGEPMYTLNLSRGEWHLAILPGKHYRNAEYQDDPGLPRRTYRRLGPLDPATDPRAAFLLGVWQEQGHVVTVHEAVKIAVAHVVGQVAPEAAGRRIQTHEGWFTLAANMYLLRSPSDTSVYWLVEEPAMPFQYCRITTPQGTQVRQLR